MQDIAASSSAPERPVPVARLAVRIRLSHGVAQIVANQVGADLLHIKGPAVDPAVRPMKASTDADVLVRASHVERFLAGLSAAGWREQTGFDDGSAFGHAANWYHDGLGYLDVHRKWPGPTLPADDVFDRWWSERSTVVLANVECAVPSIEAQTLIALLHAARDQGHRRREITRLWHEAEPDRQAAIREQAHALGADVALAAATGDLESFRDAPDYHLWRTFSSTGTDRLDDWFGRWQATTGARAKVKLVGRALTVNRAHLAMRLGHAPSSRDVAAEWVRRWGRLVSELARRVVSRMRSDRGSAR